MGLRAWWGDQRAKALEEQEQRRQARKQRRQTFAERKAALAAGGFFTNAAYLGGHPMATTPGFGELRLEDDQLSFSGMGKTGPLRLQKVPIEFSIPVDHIETVEYKGEEELRKAPKGYWAPLPIAWAAGYGDKQKHPLAPDTAKLTKLLIISFTDAQGDGQRLVIGNAKSFRMGGLSQVARDSSGHEIANKIAAARYRVKAERGDP